MHSLLLLAALITNQGMPIKSGATSDLLTVNTNKAALVSIGVSTRPTYIINGSGLTTTSAYNLNVEASASTGFKLLGWCVGLSNATAAVATTITVQRRTTASSNGTVCVAEQSSSCSMSKMDPGDANFDGVARVTATQGSAGAVLDAVGVQVGELGAGTADPAGPAPICKFYGQAGEKLPIVSAGTANGISISVGTLGAGALAAGSISMYIIEE